MDDETISEVKRILAEKEKLNRAASFKAWCADMDGTPHRWKPTIKAGCVVDIELQPHWWLGEGVELINCRHIDSQVALMDGAKGAVMSSHLPYAVFLAGVESFLKGMYLCRFAECRRIATPGYISPKRREVHLQVLKTFGHNLQNLIKALKRLKAYRTDVSCMRFLNIIDGAVRRFYYPLDAADKNYGWATARYPKRFYNDKTKHGRADSYRSFPQQEFIAQLFEWMDRYLEKKWDLRRGLIEDRQARRARRNTSTPSAPESDVK